MLRDVDNLPSVLLALRDGTTTDPIVAPGEFRAWFDGQSSAGSRFPPKSSGARGISGMCSSAASIIERHARLLVQNARELRARGISRQMIRFLYPSSHETFEGNSELIRSKFSEIARGAGKTGRDRPQSRGL